ncbi:hypothetical protein Agub_g8894, partial [Astrephomene gubernaculifera]
MGTNAGVDLRIGWEENEQKEFLKALRQPLMVQTPLQLVIENVFQRLQSQAVFMQQMKEKMDRIAVKDVQADELLDRIKLLESRQGDAAGPKLNPFNQQEILARLDALEGKVQEASGERGPPSETGDGSISDLEARLQRLEKRMSGVYNLNGKLVAIEQIASGLGLSIPDLEYPTGGGPPPQTPPQAAALPPLSLGAWRPPTHPPGSQLPPLLHQPSHHMQLGTSPEGGVGGPAGGAAGGAGGIWGPSTLTATGAPPATASSDDGLSWLRLGSPQVGGGGYGGAAAADVPAPPGSAPAASQARSGSPQVYSPRAAAGSPPVMSRLLGSAGLPPNSAASLGSTTTGHGSPGGPNGGNGGNVNVSVQKLTQVAQELAALRDENEAMKEGMERLSQQINALRSGLGSNAVESLSRLQQVEESVGALQAQVADLAAARRDAAARQGSEVSFADFSLLRSQMEAAVAETRAATAAVATLSEREVPALTARVDELTEGLKKSAEPRDIDALFHERLNALEAAVGDMRNDLRGSLEAALESAVKLEDLQIVEEALEGKASTEALRLLQQQTQALGQAVAGIGEALALRPDLAAGGAGGGGAGGAGAAGGGPIGPLATKLRCLTCDQPIKPPVQGGSSWGGGGPGGKGGGFLPRLESMPLPAKEGPVGSPGMMIAELRASKEE